MATPKIVDGVEDTFTPIVYIDLKKADLSVLEGLEPGQKVRVVIEGKLVSMTKRAENRTKTGSLAVQTKKVRLAKMDSTFDQMMEEDNE